MRATKTEKRRRQKDLMNMLDLRSDTVTRPTPAMREAMKEASVGDDVLGDDPTVQELERRAAVFLGKEAALFVPSGHMANLLAIMAHCQRRESEMIVGDLSHVHLWERGSVASLAGVHSRVVRTNPDGTLDLGTVASMVRDTVDIHCATSRLLCLENTHNETGGRVLPLSYMEAAGKLCATHGLKLHLDGARLANAAVALRVSPAQVAAAADSVSMCLSKGLAAPIGSVVAGTSQFVSMCRGYRKALGGGMRQAGVLAAPALLSLSVMYERLCDDHHVARTMAMRLNNLDGVHIDVDNVETNIFRVHIECTNVGAFVRRMRESHSILLGEGSVNGVFRFVTHYQVPLSSVDRVVLAVHECLRVDRGDSPQPVSKL